MSHHDAAVDRIAKMVRDLRANYVFSRHDGKPTAKDFKWAQAFYAAEIAPLVEALEGTLDALDHHGKECGKCRDRADSIRTLLDRVRTPTGRSA